MVWLQFHSLNIYHISIFQNTLVGLLAWMLQNPEKTMPIYDILGVMVIAFPLATNPSNIHSGF